MNGAVLPIAAVERDTGLSKDTLRIWERRYGFPMPLRDAQGGRNYPTAQVERLRMLKRLLDAGHRPGKLMSLTPADLQRLAGSLRVGAARDEPLPPLLAPLRQHDGPALRRGLHQALATAGLQRFVTEQLAPLNAEVGAAWMRGQLSVAQEHVYTEGVQQVLRQAIGSLPEPRPGALRVLLATLPQENHGLGLLMAEALLSLHGCRCVSLGVNVPLDGIVAAARSTAARAVGLTFTQSFNPAQAQAALRELRAQLRPETAIWVGGNCAALLRRLPPGVEAVPHIGGVGALLESLRHRADTLPS